MKFHCIISSHSCIFRWYNAIIPNLRQNSNISVHPAGVLSILGVLPAITQHRTSASGFWEIPGASWPAARMSRPIPAGDNAVRIADTASISCTPPRIPKLTRSLCDLRVAFSHLRGLDLVFRYLCVHNMSHVSFVRVFLSGAARPCLA